MFCASCGKENDDNNRNCISCGAPLHGSGPHQPREHVPNHLVWAILATVFCCLPTGIAAIVYAAQVNGKLEAGNVQGAREASDNARMWSWISFGIGLVFGLGYFLLVVAAGL